MFYILLMQIMLFVMSALVNQLLTYGIAFVSAVSGWVAFLYGYFSSKPKIKGKILQVMMGYFTNPKTSEKLTVFIPFLYLTNARENPLHIVDYLLEVETEKGWKKMNVIRGNFESNFQDAQGKPFQIPDFMKNVIYKQEKAVEFGKPFYGYLAFFGDLKYYETKIKRYRITCVDVFDNKHKITTSIEKFTNPYRLEEIFGIKITKIARN